MTEDYVNYELDDMNQNDLNEKNCELDDMNQNDLNGGNKRGLDKEEGEKSTDTVNEYLIHSNMNENETETKQYNLVEVIYECPDDTSPVLMEYCVNEELGYSNKNDLIE